MEVMQTMSKLATLSILAVTTLSIAAAQLGLVASGAQPGVQRRRGGLHQWKQGLSQGLASTVQALYWEKCIIASLRGKQQPVILTSLGKRSKKHLNP